MAQLFVTSIPASIFPNSVEIKETVLKEANLINSKIYDYTNFI